MKCSIGISGRSPALFRHNFNDDVALRTNVRFQNTELSYRQIYVAGFATTGTGANRNTDFSTITRGGGGADEDFDMLTADTHLTVAFNTGGLRHDLLAGVDYQDITGENYQHFNTGVTSNPATSIPNLSLFAPTYGGSIPTRDLTALNPGYTNTDSERDQIGVYVQDQISIERLRLIASGRFDDYDQETLNKRNGALTPLSQHAFTMRVGALYDFAVGLAPYVSYSESFEPQAGTTYDGALFEPVTGRQYEAGVKYQPPGTNAIFALSAYDLRRQNVPVGHPEAGTNGIPSNAQIQIGETVIRGIELEGRGEVTPGLDVVLSATVLDAEITQGAPASGIVPSTTGTRPLGTPEKMASAFITYDLGRSGAAGGAWGGLMLGGGARYVARFGWHHDVRRREWCIGIPGLRDRWFRARGCHARLRLCAPGPVVLGPSDCAQRSQPARQAARLRLPVQQQLLLRRLTHGDRDGALRVVKWSASSATRKLRRESL